MYFGITITKHKYESCLGKKILFYHYENKKSYVDDDDEESVDDDDNDDDGDDDDDDGNNIDNHHYYYHGDKLGCSPILFCSVILQTLSTELYKCNVGIYRAPNEDMRVIERLAARTGSTGNSTKCSIIGGDLNLPCVDWNGNAGGNSGTQALINSLVWENGYSQVTGGPTRGDA